VPGPSVGLVNVRFTQATAFETTAAFTLRLSNETPEPLQLDGGVHKIYLNGLYVGEGLSGDTLDLPRLGTATQDVTVHLSNLRMVTRIRPYHRIEELRLPDQERGLWQITSGPDEERE
jgi:LEA14-like dessication related protein